MAWRYHGRARVSTTNPQAFAVCDRCCRWWNRTDLTWQFDWAGAKLINKRILVCRTCLDVPQEQLRAIAIPPDPIPIRNPRPDLYAPLLPFLLADTWGGDVLDTDGAFVTSPEGYSTPTNATTRPMPDGYVIEAPDGGPVILVIPESTEPLLDGLGNPLLDGFGNPIMQ